jgi:hypothetical protein
MEQEEMGNALILTNVVMLGDGVEWDLVLYAIHQINKL